MVERFADAFPIRFYYRECRADSRYSENAGRYSSPTVSTMPLSSFTLVRDASAIWFSAMM